MSPKSLLRHPNCISPIEDIASGRFAEMIDDPDVGNSAKETKKIKRALYCTGEIYYDLLERKIADKRDDVAIIRLEQLYPFPVTQVNKVIKKYENAEPLWVQEEPSNMGAWQYILAFYRRTPLRLIARPSSASPATGYKKKHDKQQKEIVDRAFAD